MEQKSPDNQNARRKIFLRAAGAMFGFVIAAALAVGLWLWQQSKPERWDSDAITATFDSVDTEGKEQTLLFFYTVENHTDRDYRVESGAGATTASRLKEQGSLSFDASGKFFSVEFPLFVPAHEKVLCRIHVDAPYKSDTALPSDSDRKARRAAVAAYVAEKFENLDGFVLFDQAQHRKVVFPKAW